MPDTFLVGIVLMGMFCILAFLGGEGIFKINSNLDNNMLAITIACIAAGYPLTIIGAIEYAL